MRCTMLAPPFNAQRSLSVSIWNVREMTDEEGDGANTCNPSARKKPIYYLQSWLGETFRVWMGTADPGGQIFRHISFMSGENLCKVWRKNPQKTHQGVVSNIWLSVPFFHKSKVATLFVRRFQCMLYGRTWRKVLVMSSFFGFSHHWASFRGLNIPPTLSLDPSLDLWGKKKKVFSHCQEMSFSSGLYSFLVCYVYH